MCPSNPANIASEEGLRAQNKKRFTCMDVLVLSYQSLGVVYGDLSTSPLYVYKTTFSGKLSLHEDDEEVFGVLSFIFWTLTLIPLFKYIYFVLSADDNGEGGTFALYSLLCRHARLCILPNQQAVDESLSAYDAERSADTRQSARLKEFFNRHPKIQKGLLLVVLLGTCMAIGDGVLTPTISVLSAVSGVRVKITHLHENYVVAISCIILVVLFSLQHHGTRRVGFMFAPIVIAWLLCISGIGIYNICRWNPGIFRALSPYYMYRFLKSTGVEGWKSLGGVVLCITGSETMFGNLGHFSPLSIKVAFTFLVYPCLILAYMGEAAFLSKHHEDIQRSFYKAIPEAVFWPVFVVATMAAIVGSQAVITATFSMIYIPEVNWSLLCLCLAVTIGLRNTNTIGHAYGLAVTTVIFTTTLLMLLVIIIVWKQRIINAIAFLMFFGSIELLYVSASIIKIPEGGWIPLVLSMIFMSVMYTWNYGTLKKHEFALENKVSAQRILAMGPNLGIVRVPGIGIIYADLVTGIPAVFGHFATNLPAFHQVLVFVCIKSVQVPYVTEAERFLIGRIGPKDFHMFRCIVRYGYKELQRDNPDFENRLVSKIIAFVEMEEFLIPKGRRSCDYGASEDECVDVPVPVPSAPHLEADVVSNSHTISVRFDDYSTMEGSLCKDESLDILKAKESGVVYIVGRPIAKAKKSSSLIKKFVINFAYTFLSNNCRDPDVLLKVPHSLLLEVGMVYNV